MGGIDVIAPLSALAPFHHNTLSAVVNEFNLLHPFFWVDTQAYLQLVFADFVLSVVSWVNYNPYAKLFAPSKKTATDLLRLFIFPHDLLSLETLNLILFQLFSNITFHLGF